MSEYSPYTPPKANTDRPQVSASRTPFILMGVIAVFAYVTGITDVLMRNSGYYNLYYVGTMVIYAVLGVAWYQADATRLGRRHSGLMVVAIVMVLALSIPVYLFRSRGAARGALATLLFVLFLVACVILSGLGKMTAVDINRLLTS